MPPILTLILTTLAQSPPVVQPLQLQTSDTQPPPVPASNDTWMLLLAATMCLAGLVLLTLALTRIPAVTTTLTTTLNNLRGPTTKHAPREGPALFAAAAHALDIPKPRAKLLLELAESQNTNPLGLLLSDHAVNKAMVAQALTTREKRLYA
jgi:hypothetical protein